MINRLSDEPSLRSRQNCGPHKSSGPFAAIDLPKTIEPVERLIVNNPALALIVAFTVGVTIACLVKRR